MPIVVHLEPNNLGAELANQLRRAAQAALADQGQTQGELSLVLADAQQLRRLNRRFAGVDRPTDVLAFADGQPDPGSGLAYHGDVIICLPLAKSQAQAAGHSLAAELTLLTVHGVLHLLGHDHADPHDRLRMQAAQQRILAGLGLAISAELPE